MSKSRGFKNTESRKLPGRSRKVSRKVSRKLFLHFLFVLKKVLVPGLNVDLCALFIMASTIPLHTPPDSGSEPGYGPIRSSDHSPVDPLPERRPPALPYGDLGLVTVGALARISRSGV